MQTFLPSVSFQLSAMILDDKRLNKQIIEAKTIHNSITGINPSWMNHPIVKMWKDYPDALALYYNECLHQWKDVRHRNHSYEPIKVDVGIDEYDMKYIYHVSEYDIVLFPSWLGDERLHSSHRANLLRKDYQFYSKYEWNENTMKYWSMPYWWGEFGYGKIPIEKKKKVEVRNVNDSILKKVEWKPTKFHIRKLEK